MQRALWLADGRKTVAATPTSFTLQYLAPVPSRAAGTSAVHYPHISRAIMGPDKLL